MPEAKLADHVEIEKENYYPIEFDNPKQAIQLLKTSGQNQAGNIEIELAEAFFSNPDKDLLRQQLVDAIEDHTEAGSKQREKAVRGFRSLMDYFKIEESAKDGDNGIVIDFAKAQKRKRLKREKDNETPKHTIAASLFIDERYTELTSEYGRELLGAHFVYRTIEDITAKDEGVLFDIDEQTDERSEKIDALDTMTNVMRDVCSQHQPNLKKGVVEWAKFNNESNNPFFDHYRVAMISALMATPAMGLNQAVEITNQQRAQYNKGSVPLISMLGVLTGLEMKFQADPDIFDRLRKLDSDVQDPYYCDLEGLTKPGNTIEEIINAPEILGEEFDLDVLEGVMQDIDFHKTTVKPFSQEQRNQLKKLLEGGLGERIERLLPNVSEFIHLLTA